jgi:glutamate-ammonia-ligase adenylyltransferase
MIEALAQFQRATLFRIAVADVSGTLPIMKVSDALTDLAELVLREALDVAWRDLTDKHGRPQFEVAGMRHTAGFGVIGYGKLGGIELSYGSDLDVVFLHDSTGERQQTDGEKPLDNAMFFGRLVRRLVHFLTTQTSSGVLYEVDTRLRPSGRSGLLVVNLEGFEKYQEENAWTWEHQALLRSRPVAGSEVIATEFQRIRAETLRSRVRRERLLDDVLTMRDKMRAQLDRSGESVFDLKQGKGGIGDIEFLVQYLVLRHAREHDTLFYWSDNIRQLDALRDCRLLPAGDALKLQECYKAFRLRSHRLALDGRPALVDAHEFAGEREFVTATWRREMSEQK